MDELRPAQVAVDEERDEQRVEHGDAGALGGGEDAGAHAAEDDADEQEAGHRDQEELEGAGEAGEGLGRVAAAAGDPVGGDR
jgi:hypothetical protein